MTAREATKTRSAVKKRAPACKAVDAHAVRERLTAKVLSGADEILDRVIEAAKTGNYLPAKFLFEFAGIMEPLPKPDEEGDTQSRLRSLVDLLLESAQTPQADVQQETPLA